MPRNSFSSIESDYSSNYNVPVFSCCGTAVEKTFTTRTEALAALTLDAVEQEIARIGASKVCSTTTFKHMSAELLVNTQELLIHKTSNTFETTAA